MYKSALRLLAPRNPSRPECPSSHPPGVPSFPRFREIFPRSIFFLRIYTCWTWLFNRSLFLFELAVTPRVPLSSSDDRFLTRKRAYSFFHVSFDAQVLSFSLSFCFFFLSFQCIIHEARYVRSINMINW